ncbi:MAG: tRNA (guanine-N1)-methyltransferase [Candidatus Methanoglobus sp.]
MRLRELFVEKLRNLGIKRIGVKIRIPRSKDIIRALALEVANGKAEVFRGDGGINFSFDLEGKYLPEPPEAYVGTAGERLFGKEDLIRGRYFPIIAVDCRFYDLHSDKEKRKVHLQVTKTLGTVREFMWDEKLVVAAKDFGVGIYCERLEEFLLGRNIDEVVLLDPSGDEVFKGEKAECYVIGGIVDKGENRNLTKLIGDELEKAGIKCRRQRIELRGDIIGVPDRINHIAEIVLRVVLDGSDAETAIRAVQPVVVAKWRLRKELPKRAIRLRLGEKTIRVLAKSVFWEFDWLNVRQTDFYDVCRGERLYLVSDEVFDRIKKLRWDEKRKYYVLS